MKNEGELLTNREKESKEGNEKIGEETTLVTQSKEKDMQVSKFNFCFNKSQSKKLLLLFLLCHVMSCDEKYQ